MEAEVPTDAAADAIARTAGVAAFFIDERTFIDEFPIADATFFILVGLIFRSLEFFVDFPDC